MAALAPDELVCDMAETYHVLDWRALGLPLAATLAGGLRETSRTCMALNHAPITTDTLLQGGVAAGEKQRLTLRGTLGVLAGAAVVVAGGLSLLASAFPDGLEWSLQRLTGSTELETTGPVQAFFARIQEWTALLPDYNFAGSDAAAGTSAAGIIGAVVVLAVVILGVKLVKKAVHRRGSSAQGH